LAENNYGEKNIQQEELNIKVYSLFFPATKNSRIIELSIFPSTSLQTDPSLVSFSPKKEITFIEATLVGGRDTLNPLCLLLMDFPGLSHVLG
jgi:hypothetical protein